MAENIELEYMEEETEEETEEEMEDKRVWTIW